MEENPHILPEIYARIYTDSHNLKRNFPLKTHPFYFYSTLYIKPPYLQKTNIPTLLQIMFLETKHDAIYHNSFEYNHIFY